MKEGKNFIALDITSQYFGIPSKVKGKGTSFMH